MATTTYYFDGHSGITDVSGFWVNDSGAFDGDTATRATIAIGGTGNYLRGVGTTAPGSGTTITQVRARINTGGVGATPVQTNADVYSADETELLGSASDVIDNSTTWGSYVTLTPPTGGWSWTELQELIIRFKPASGVDPDPYSYCAGSGEIEVTYDDPDAELTNIVSISNVVSITL